MNGDEVITLAQGLGTADPGHATVPAKSCLEPIPGPPLRAGGTWDSVPAPIKRKVSAEAVRTRAACVSAVMLLTP